MDINYIKEFITLAEINNYLEASESLFISQSTLSKHIQSMEKELGVSLFDRSTRSVRLSSAGECFLEYAKQIAALQYEYTTALYNQSAHTKEIITIGSIPIMAPYHITDIIMKFKNENKKFSVNLIEGESAQLKEMLRKNQCELAFIRDEDDTSEEFTKISYTKDTLAVVLPQYHPLATLKSIHIEQLKDEDFLFLQQGSLLYTLCTKACVAQGFQPNITFTGKRAENIIDLIEKGMGISLLMKKPIQYLSNSHIRIIDVTPTIETQVKLYYKKDTKLSTAAKHFVDCLYSNKTTS